MYSLNIIYVVFVVAYYYYYYCDPLYSHKILFVLSLC